MASQHAMIRFGLGRRGGEALPGDPGAWLAGQLGPAAARPGDADLPTTADGILALKLQRALRAARRAGTTDTDDQHPLRDLHKIDVADFIASAVTTQAPFRERLAWFWLNHFTISLRQRRCAAFAGAFLREAIRPHVTGRFADMLLAVMRHPAMLIYLDNANSVGPDSRAGRAGSRGLNENLARECLELHTVGVGAGYSQADVTAFAAVLTGWSIEAREPPLGFRFRPGLHQPGGKTVLGHDFPEGEQGGIELLEVLATHPATYRHLATKLACHFAGDQPTAAEVAPVERALAESGGDLGAAAHALIALPAAWRPLVKLRSPQDLVIAALRAADPPADSVAGLVQPAAAALASLGQPLWQAPLPNGWPDLAADWSGPASMLTRVDWAYRFAGSQAGLDPASVATQSMGGLLRATTLAEMQQAGSRRDALTLLVASPEFQRR